MCILLLSLRQHRRYPLVVAANREEDYARPARAADFWDDAPELLAGRDLSAGGTWLGITRAGRFAAITNFRDPPSKRAGRPSRGHLVSAFLLGEDTPAAYLAGVADRADRYNGFSLIVGAGEDWLYFSNREGQVRRLGPGLYGLSNHLLDTPWPKVKRGKQALAALLTTGGELETQALFAMLADRTVAADAELPDTGFGLERERALSAQFVTMGTYGTRCSTAVLVDHDGNVDFSERSFAGDPERYTSATHRFRIEHRPSAAQRRAGEN